MNSVQCQAHSPARHYRDVTHESSKYQRIWILFLSGSKWVLSFYVLIWSFSSLVIPAKVTLLIDIGQSQQRTFLFVTDGCFSNGFIKATGLQKEDLSAAKLLKLHRDPLQFIRCCSALWYSIDAHLIHGLEMLTYRLLYKPLQARLVVEPCT